MRKLGICILGLCLLTNKLYAGLNNFDIFGVDAEIQKKIFSSCSNLMEQYLKISKAIDDSPLLPGEKMLLRRKKIEQEIASKVNQIDNFEMVRISAIYYPTDKKTYATLDLVKKNENYRVPMKSKVLLKELGKKSQGLKDLFEVWNEYEDKNIRLMKKNQMNLGEKVCPVTHCIWGFDDKELKEILPKIREGVAKYRNEIVEIIKNSSDYREREKAVFIFAHDDNYQDQANILINLTDDPNNSVRNNVMRVLGSIVSKYKVGHIDVNRIISALNYPYVTDRNKAAYVLLGIVKNEPASHRIVITHAGKTLLELLKLQQPNNHDFAYQILKVLSQKNYSDRDYESWERWIRSQQNTLSSS